MTERERLIEIVDNYEFDSTRCNLCDRSDSDCAKCGSEALADDLLQNGVIVPPCKIGDTVYVMIFYTYHKPSHIITEKVVGFRIIDAPENRGHKRENYIITLNKNTNSLTHFRFNSLGKSVFLTQEEAEKALKEREK